MLGHALREWACLPRCQGGLHGAFAGEWEREAAGWIGVGVGERTSISQRTQYITPVLRQVIARVIRSIKQVSLGIISQSVIMSRCMLACGLKNSLSLRNRGAFFKRFQGNNRVAN
jgi:hypothetical protein